MDLSRRRLIQAGLVSGAAAFLPPLAATAAGAAVPAGLTRFTEPLAVPELLDLRGGGLGELWMRNAEHSFHTALGPTRTFAYQSTTGASTYLGPVIVAQRGTPLTLRVHNDLGADGQRHPLADAIDRDLVPEGSDDADAPRASVHLHGGNTEPGSDGGPTEAFLPGHAHDYHYANLQDAAGLWYHDHALGITRLNVYAGLASGYLRHAPGTGIDTGDGAHLPAGDFEVPLILQDRMFNADGSFAYPGNPDLGRPWAPEFFGDVATVNGTAWPTLDVARGHYRFRVYNGSNARFYLLRLAAASGSLPFLQIGTDGGLLGAPVPLTKLLLGPGERADLVVDFSALPAGSLVRLTNGARAPYPTGPRAVRRGGSPLADIMQFRATGAVGHAAPPPASLRATPITSLSDFTPKKIRPMALVEVQNAQGVPLTALINNRRFGAAPTEVARDTLERWEIVNTTGDAHPIHLHFVQFQVLDRQKVRSDAYLAACGFLDPSTGLVVPEQGEAKDVGPFLYGQTSPPAPHEQGWKDTVVAMPGEVTRIIVPFGAGAVPDKPLAIGSSFTGTYVWHCHILEHEDNDMMQSFSITRWGDVALGANLHVV
ncbi:multicopper oxidase family protein [Sinomonas flava]|uniref:multicopper oxidase family protein n=1 Tax=Sinomonas flava TaxID=496857 RepID=UPI0039A4EDF9